MKVTFVLPGYSDFPIGGFKAAYLFANGLAARGHTVAVLHPHSLSPAPGLVNRLKRVTWPARTRWRRAPLVGWCRIHPEVALALVPDLSDSFAPDADVVVATAWQTAAAVSRWRTSRGRKLCLVADFEHWSVASDDERAVIEHAFADLEVVAYGPAVRGMLASFDRVPVAEIRVGVDGEEFGLDNAVPSRPAVVGFPVREEPFKGSWDAIAAASLIHLRRPDVHLCAFGRGPLGFAPQWLTYHVLPTNAELRRMYNNLAVFVHPSHYEAWPLPPMEAMICGASVVAADSIGVRGYARDGHNATIVPPGRPDLLAAAVCDLLADEPRRSRLAEQGRVDADRYQWKDAVTQLETVIREACEGRT